MNNVHIIYRVHYKFIHKRKLLILEPTHNVEVGTYRIY